MADDTDIQPLIDLAKAGLEKATDAQDALGDRPDYPDGPRAWDKAYDALDAQIQDFTANVTRLSALALSNALKDQAAALAKLKTVTDLANARIKKIKALSDVLATLGAVIDVAVAVVALGTAPSIDNASKVVSKIEALGKLVSGKDDAEPAQKDENAKPAAKPKSK